MPFKVHMFGFVLLIITLSLTGCQLSIICCAIAMLFATKGAGAFGDRGASEQQRLDAGHLEFVQMEAREQAAQAPAPAENQAMNALVSQGMAFKVLM